MSSNDQCAHNESLELRVLGLFQDRRDSEFAASVFHRAGIPLVLVEDVPDLSAEIRRGVGAIILTERSLQSQDWEGLSEALDHQPVWSAVPVIVLLSGPAARTDLPALRLPSEVVLLDQPVRVDPLMAVVRSALKNRKRQYFLRNRLEELEREIEKRKQAERRSSFLAALVESTTQSVISLTKNLDGTIQTWNKGAERIYGYTAEEVVGRNISMLVPPGYLDDTVDMLETVKRGGTIEGHETFRRKKDGSIITVSITVSPVKDDAGKIIGASKIGLDITGRKKAEEALRASEERFRALVTASSQALFRMSGDWNVMQNLYSGKFLEPTEAPRRSWFQDYIPPDDQPHVMAVIQDAIRTKGIFELEHRVWRIDGSIGWTLSRAVPLLDADGDIIEWFGAAEDISERKRAEEELHRAKDELEVRVRGRTAELTRAFRELRAESEERIRAVEELRRNEQMLMQQSRLAAMGEMLANISHQWRQPLNVLGLILQELKRQHERGAFTAEFLEKNVGRARELIGHMSQTIDDFRSFLAPERVRLPFEVGEAVEKAVSMVADNLKEVDVQVTAEEPVSVEGFRNEYAQVVMNILINARDAFRERGTSKPSICIQVSREGKRSVVTIADNGGGIPEEIMGRIFEPYFTTKPPDKGTGIGLFMSRNIIEKNMGGSLTVRNTGEGAEFRIEV